MMATVPESNLQADEREALLRDWLDRMSNLVRTVDAWASAQGWATRTIDKKMEDPDVGNHRAPALLLQKETVRIILEPTGRSAPGAEGTADFYLMPAYDDIVTLYYHEGWKVDYPREMAGRLGVAYDETPKEFTREAFLAILEELSRDAA